jgi:cobalt-zinc-cadmium efflux system outer membrane protein
MFMNLISRAALCGACVLVCPRLGAGQTASLSLDDVIAIARQRAPAIVAARARIDEARGRLTGAAVLLRANPEVEGAAGARTGGGDLLQAEVGVTQFFETGGQRSARIAAARAEVEREEALADDVTRRVLGRVAAAFYRALHANEAVAVAQKSEAIAAEVARIARRRLQAGEASHTDVNIARAAEVRERAAALRREAQRERRHGELRRLIGSDGSVALALLGRLNDRGRHRLDDLEKSAAERPDLRALLAAARGAEAEHRLGRAEAWPDVGVGARYERDERSDVGLGIVNVRLPVFDRGQGLRAEAAARASRLREMAAARRAEIANEVRSAFAVLGLHQRAVRELESEQLPRLDENEKLAQRSFEAGEMSLAELLAVRREILQMRNDHLDQLLATKLAEVELEVSAGLLQ